MKIYIPTQKEISRMIQIQKRFKEAQKTHEENCPICSGKSVFDSAFTLCYVDKNFCASE